MNEFVDSQINTEDWIEADVSEPSDMSEESGGSLGLKLIHFMKLYWKKRRLAFAIIVAGFVISVVVAVLRPNIYKSTTTLMPPDNSSPYSAMLGMLAGGSSTSASLGSEAFGLSSPGELIVAILQSRTAQDSLIAQFDLMHYYKARVIEDARKALDSNTKIDQDRKSGVISVSVSDRNAQFASKLAQGYVTELNRIMTENSTSAARRERIFLEERLKNVKIDLENSSKALSQFSTKNKAFDIQGQAKSMVDAELKLESDLEEGRSQLAALLQSFSEDNYRVKALRARNAELEREINALSGSSKGNGTSASSSTGAYPSAGELPALGVTYYDLERRVKVDEELWVTLTKQYEMARVQEAKEIPTIQVLDAANVPNVKSAPIRRVIVLFATFLSFLLSCIVVFAVSKWEDLDEQSEPKKLFARTLAKVRRSPKEPALI